MTTMGLLGRLEFRLATGWSTLGCHIYPGWSHGQAVVYRLVKKKRHVSLRLYHPCSALFVADVGIVEEHLFV